MNTVFINHFSGYVRCKSSFGEHMITCNEADYIFDPGITLLKGDVDSGNWAISYTISMYKRRAGCFILSPKSSFGFDGTVYDLKMISCNACYLDTKHTLFSSRKSTRKLVEIGLRTQNDFRNANQIRELFEISSDRFERPLSEVGNEKFRCMAAIGYSNHKHIYCFPWLSNKSVKYYGKNIVDVLEKLQLLKEFVLLPTNYEFADSLSFQRVYDFDNTGDGSLC